MPSSKFSTLPLLTKYGSSIIAVSAVVVIVATAVVSGVQDAQYYVFIRRIVASQMPAELRVLTSSRPVECYPATGAKEVCRQIVYQVSTQDCPAIAKALKNTTDVGQCTRMTVTRHMDNITFEYSLLPQADGAQLRVLYVSK